MTETTPTTTDTGELLAWIGRQHHRLLASTAGLTEEQLRAPVVSSGWSVLGLLGHTRDTTVLWLHHIVAGRPVDGFDEEAEIFDNDPQRPAGEVVQDLREACAAAVEQAREIPADAAPGWWPEGAWGGYRQETVRGCLLHLLTELAAHAGHMDIARELTDGGVWDFAVDGVRVP